MKMNDVVSTLKDIKHELGDILPPEAIDRVLETMGLQVRRSPIRGFASGTGLFLVGVIIGGAAALLFAPKAGLEVRSDLEDKLDTVIAKLKTMVGKGEAEEEDTSKSASASRPSDKSTTATTNQTGTTRPGGIHS